MAACPKCGRDYPVGSGNQCYNCFRDGKEHKRAGKRRPKPTSEEVPTGGAKRDPLLKSLSPSEIANISKWKGSDFEKIGLPEKSSRFDETTGIGKASFMPTFGRRRPSTVSNSEATRKPSVRIRLEGVNAFLDELFQEPTLLSDVLAEAGYSSRQIGELKRQVGRFLPYLADTWSRHLHRFFKKSSLLIVRHFGLDGFQPRRGGVVSGSVGRIHDMMFRLHDRRAEFRRELLAAAEKFVGPADRR